jgi:hypothetical protein
MLSESSVSTTQQTDSPQVRRAKLATQALFKLLPPQTFGDARAFLAATTAIFSTYPLGVMRAAIVEIAVRTERPSLKVIKEVCEEIYEPIRHQEWRAQVALDIKRSLAPPRHPRTPEQQAAIDAQVEAARRQLGIQAGGMGPKAVLMPPSADAPYSSRIPRPDDGKHAQRIAADCAARAARNAVLSA